jgi:hypothetical protein
MKRQMIGLAVLAAAALAAILGLAQQTSVTLKAASTEISGIDILAVTKAARDLPEHNYSTH